MTFQEFRTWQPQVVFQEVPNHVSLAFTVSGCPLHCEGCHSQDTWPINSGQPLSNIQFCKYLEKYQTMITCVLFFGGEWSPDQLISKLKRAQEMGLKTCLYSGFERLPRRITRHLDFLKTGPWRSHLGGLDQPNTNQKFFNLNTNEDLTYQFQHPNITQEEQYNAIA